jgi:hypothetical protein
MKALFLVCTKLLGLLGLYWASATLVQVGPFVVSSLSGRLEDNSHTVWFICSFASYSILSFALAVVLLVKTEWVATALRIPDDPLPQSAHADQVLRIGILLLGLYFVIASFPSLVRTVLEMSRDSWRYVGIHSLQMPKLVANALQFLLGLILVLKPASVLNALNNNSK